MLISSYEILDVVHAVSLENATSDTTATLSPATRSSIISCEAFIIKRQLQGFLRSLYVSATASFASPLVLFVMFHGILLLFMIRYTLRCTSRYSGHGLKAFGEQANQDPSFDDGLACALYQPMILVLESEEVTFDELSRRAGKYQIAVAEARRVVNIPNPGNKTPMDHIRYFFQQVFPNPPKSNK